MNTVCGNNGGTTRAGEPCRRKVKAGQLCCQHSGQSQCTIDCCICAETVVVKGGRCDRSNGVALGPKGVVYKHDGGGDEKCLSAVVTQCGHQFCEPCYSQWMCQQRVAGAPTTCPLCRQRVSSLVIVRLCSMIDILFVQQSRPYTCMRESVAGVEAEQIQVNISLQPTLWQFCKRPEFEPGSEYVFWPVYTLHESNRVFGTMDFYSLCALVLKASEVPRLRVTPAVRSDGVPSEWPHYSVDDESSVMGRASRSRMYYIMSCVSRFLEVKYSGMVPSTVHFKYCVALVKALRAYSSDVPNVDLVRFAAKVAQKHMDAIQEDN